MEHALVATAVTVGMVWLVAWRGETTWGRVAFWAVAPDLVFVPIAVAGRGGAWPRWGAALYNAAHTHLVALPALAVASALSGHVVWPLVAWVAHIEWDRAFGFDLRAWR